MPTGTVPAEVTFHEVADGATMAYREFGDPSGPPVVIRLRFTRARAPSDDLVRRHLVLSAACRAHDATGRLPEIRAPALVLVGEHDGLTRPARAAELAGMIGAELVVVPGAAHALPEQRPQAYARRVSAFLGGAQ